MNSILVVGDYYSGASFRITSSLPQEAWINVGFVTNDQNFTQFSAYFNAQPVNVIKVVPATTRGPWKSGISNGDLVLGSASAQNSNLAAPGAKITSICFWFQKIQSIQAGLLMGYTAKQQTWLQQSNYFWTTDPYINMDASAQITTRTSFPSLFLSNNPGSAIPGFSLASLYVPNDANLRTFGLDHENKSPVPILDMTSSGYFMLGNTKSNVTSWSALQWKNDCLLDPTPQTCSALGFTLSLWVKITSVSGTRTRFLFNSGNFGPDSGVYQADYRGISLFTSGSLLGISISTSSQQWSLIIDSSVYTLKSWINLGITWKSFAGLSLYINGINYGLQKSIPDQVYKPPNAPPYLVIGRYDSDDISTWLSPTVADQQAAAVNNPLQKPSWEMANIQIGEIAYVKRHMSYLDYVKFFRVIGNKYQPKNDPNFYGWLGENLLVPSTYQLIISKKYRRRPGQANLAPFNQASSLAVWSEANSAVNLFGSTALLLGPVENLSCLSNSSNCSNGFFLSGWFSLSTNVMQSADLNTFIQLLGGASGQMGLAISPFKTSLHGWYTPQVSLSDGNVVLGPTYWLCFNDTIGLDSNKMYSQWFHVGINFHNDILDLYFDGNIVQSCAQGSITSNNAPYQALMKSIFYAVIPKFDAQYLVASSHKQLDPSGFLSVALVTFESAGINSSVDVSQHMGLDYMQMTYFQNSDFYWPMAGQYQIMNSNRYSTFGTITRTQDKLGIFGGALCTTNQASSYLQLTGDQIPNLGGLTNLNSMCIVDSTTCNSFMVSFTFKLQNALSSPSVLLTTIPEDAANNTIGFRVRLDSVTLLLVAEIFSGNKYCSNQISIDPQMANSINLMQWTELAVFWYSDRAPSIYSNGLTVAGTISGTCQSLLSVSYSYPVNGVSYPNILIGKGANGCFSNVQTRDFTVSQNATRIFNNLATTYCYPNSAGVLQLLGPVESIATNLSTLYANGFGSSSADFSCLYSLACANTGLTLSFWIKAFSPMNSPKSGITVLNAGYIQITLAPNQQDTNYLDLSIQVCTGSKFWSLDGPKSFQWDQWTNIGITFQNVATSSSVLEMYINGERTYLTSKLKAGNSGCSSQQKLVLGSAGMSFEAAIYQLAWWNSKVVSCTQLRSSKKLLTGSCSVDESVPELKTCIDLNNCDIASGSVCLDPTSDNIQAMASNVAGLSSVDDLGNLINSAAQLIQNLAMENSTISNNQTLLNAMVSSFSIQSQLQKISMAGQSSVSTIQLAQYTAAYLESLQSPKLNPLWAQMVQLTNSTSDGVINSASLIINRLLIGLCQRISFNNSLVSVASFPVFSNTSSSSSSMSQVLPATASKIKAPSMKIHNFRAFSSGQSQVNLPTNIFAGSDTNSCNGLSVLLVSPPNSSADAFVAGGIPVTYFDLSNVTSGTQVAYPNGKNLTLTTIKASKPSQLVISSSVITIEPNQMNSTKIDLNDSTTWINFTLSLDPPNIPKAIDKYVSYYRKKWAALEISGLMQNAMNKASTIDVDLALPVLCVYWKQNSFDFNGLWASDGCYLVGANVSHVTCTCTHMTVFAIAMEPKNSTRRPPPFWELNGISDYDQHELLRFNINIAGNCVSLALLAVAIGIFVIKNCKSIHKVRYQVRINFFLSLALWHIVALVTPILEIQLFYCQIVSVAWSFSFLALHSWLCRESIYLFIAYVDGEFDSYLLNHIFWGWGLPVLFTTLTGALTRLAPFADDLMCWIARENPAMWATLAFAGLLLLISFVLTSITSCNLETPAYMDPHLIISLQFQMWQLWKIVIFECLVFTMTCLILYSPFVFSIYIYWVLASLQGVVAVIYYAIHDEELWVLIFEKKWDRYMENSRIPDSEKLLPKFINDEEIIPTGQDDMYLRSIFTNNSLENLPRKENFEEPLHDIFRHK